MFWQSLNVRLFTKITNSFVGFSFEQVEYSGPSSDNNLKKTLQDLYCFRTYFEQHSLVSANVFKIKFVVRVQKQKTALHCR